MFGFFEKGWVEWFKLGVSYSEAGRHDKAIDAFQHALLVNPEIWGVWFNLGITYVKAGQFTKAIDAHEQAVRINPGEAAAWDSLGTAYGSAGQFPKAIAAFSEAVRINPSDAQAWQNLAETYSVIGDSSNADLCSLHILPNEAGAQPVAPPTPSSSLPSNDVHRDSIPGAREHHQVSMEDSAIGNRIVVNRDKQEARYAEGEAKMVAAEEAYGVDKWGPDWRAKEAALEAAQDAAYEAEEAAEEAEAAAKEVVEQEAARAGWPWPAGVPTPTEMAKSKAAAAQKLKRATRKAVDAAENDTTEAFRARAAQKKAEMVRYKAYMKANPVLTAAEQEARYAEGEAKMVAAWKAKWGESVPDPNAR